MDNTETSDTAGSLVPSFRRRYFHRRQPQQQQTHTAVCFSFLAPLWYAQWVCIIRPCDCLLHDTLADDETGYFGT